MTDTTGKIVLSSQENNFLDLMKTRFTSLYSYSENDLSSTIQNLLNLLNILSKDKLYAEHISKEFESLGKYLNNKNVGEIQELFRQQNILNPTTLLVGGKRRRKRKSNNKKTKKSKNSKNSKTKKGGQGEDDDMIIPYQEPLNQVQSLEQTTRNLMGQAQTPAQGQIASQAIIAMTELRKIELQNQHELAKKEMDYKEKEKAREDVEKRIQLLGVPTLISGIMGYAVKSGTNLFVTPAVSVASNTLGFLDKALSFVSMNKIQTTMGADTKDLIENAGLAPALISGVLIWLLMYLIMVLAYKVQSSDISVPFVSVKKPQRDTVMIEELPSSSPTRLSSRIAQSPRQQRARSTARTRRGQFALQNGGKNTRKYRKQRKQSKHKNRSHRGKTTRKYKKQRNHRITRRR